MKIFIIFVLSFFIFSTEYVSCVILTKCKINDKILQSKFDAEAAELVQKAEYIKNCGKKSRSHRNENNNNAKISYSICLINHKIPTYFSSKIFALNSDNFLDKSTFDNAMNLAIASVCHDMQNQNSKINKYFDEKFGHSTSDFFGYFLVFLMALFLIFGLIYLVWRNYMDKKYLEPSDSFHRNQEQPNVSAQTIVINQNTNSLPPPAYNEIYCGHSSQLNYPQKHIPKKL